MPLYKIKNDKKVTQLHAKSFSLEKDLQKFVEGNLEEFFEVRFLASEWVVTGQKSGRIDTIGIDQNDVPTIIEYKRSSSDSIINQGLYYFSWIVEHPDAFRMLVAKKLNITLDSLEIPRVILIAESFSKYDTYAIEVLEKNLDLQLWTYKTYEDNIFELTAINSNANSKKMKIVDNSNESKKISKKNINTSYDLDFHRQKLPENLKIIFEDIREYIFNLDDKITESIRKMYVAFRTNKNFIEIVAQKNSVLIYLDIPIKKIENFQKEVVDVAVVGHWATGDVRFYIKSDADLTIAFDLIKQSYNFNS